MWFRNGLYRNHGMMWPFRKKHSLADSGIFAGFTDWHSHILPGVDDGVRTMEEALDILALYERLGVKIVWLTPHIMEDMPNTTAYLKECFGKLTVAYQGTVSLHLAAEYMLDNLFCERLDDNDLLPLGEKRDQLLVETSYYNAPANMYDLLERIKTKGFYPVLAHPERYMYMDVEKCKRLKCIGIKLQLNIFSLIGVFGKESGKQANSFLRNGYYDLTGTDIHSFHALQSSIHVPASLNASNLNSLQ